MRAPFVIGATLAGIAGIVVFHPHVTPSAATLNTPGTRAVGGSSTNAGATTSSAPPAAGSTAATSAASAPTTTTPRSTGAKGTASGQVTQYRFGVLQVAATVSGGRITNISTQVQSADPRSQQIDDESLPILRSEALSAQSAKIQGVSGATYTSQAFATSLQSALSSIGFSG